MGVLLVGRESIWVDNGLVMDRRNVVLRIRGFEDKQSRKEMSRRKEWHSPVTYIDGAGHRLFVGHQHKHAFEINGGGNVSLFPKHAIAQFVRAPLNWE